MTSSTACPRLCQIAAHIPADNQTLPALDSLPQTSPKLTEMSSQEDHPTVLIPGPVEFDDAVLQAMAHPRLVPKTHGMSSTTNGVFADGIPLVRAMSENPLSIFLEKRCNCSANFLLPIIMIPNPWYSVARELWDGMLLHPT